METKTSSVIDGKVVHIASNAMVFRANGTDERSKYSSEFSEKSTAVEESIKSLIAATADFGNSLTPTLVKFGNYVRLPASTYDANIGYQ